MLKLDTPKPPETGNSGFRENKTKVEEFCPREGKEYSPIQE